MHVQHAHLEPWPLGMANQHVFSVEQVRMHQEQIQPCVWHVSLEHILLWSLKQLSVCNVPAGRMQVQVVCLYVPSVLQGRMVHLLGCQHVLCVG